MTQRIKEIKVLKDYRKVSGTHLVGNIRLGYNKLVELFGEPLEGYDYKTDAEWALEIETETGKTVIATIYNWKNGKNYLGQEGPATENITRWNIGGHSTEAAELIYRTVYDK